MEKRNKQSIEVLVEAKRKAMRRMAQATNQALKLFWATVVNDCDEEIGKLLRMKRVRTTMRRLFLMVVIVNLLVLASIFIVGCQTFKGAMGDTAWLIQTGADNINVQEK